MASPAEINRAVAGAQTAWREWRGDAGVGAYAFDVGLSKGVLKENLLPLAKCVAEDNGKTLEDAKGEVFRGIEVVEFACSLPTLLMGETVENVAKGVDTHSVRQPLGGLCGDLSV